MSRYADSMARGKAAEERFVKVAEARGLTVSRSRKKDDIFKHVDFLIVDGDAGMMVDVKARKRITRADTKPQDEEIWLELKNVGGNPGWVYSEGWVAFETVEGFIVITKEKLQWVVEQYVNDDMVQTAAEALYHRYSRKGRKDLLTRVPLAVIIDHGKFWPDQGVLPGLETA